MRLVLISLCVGALAGWANSTRAAPAFAWEVRALTSADVAKMRAGGVLKEGCPVAPESLALVAFSYWRMGGGASTGRLVVGRVIADDVVAVMSDLYAARYPFARIVPIEAYSGSDERSMEADNTSAFNCREKTAAFLPDGRLAPPEFSNHSYGLAIDINPRENPYVRLKPERLEAWRATAKDLAPGRLPAALLEFCSRSPRNCDVEPKSGRPFLDRRRKGGVIRPDDAVVAAFKKRGFTWGGDWPTDSADKVRADLQHFEKVVGSN